MIVTKKHLPRRTVLRGAGAAIALPLLDGMVPAMTATRLTAAAPALRLGALYVPNGVIMREWTPTADGAAFELSPLLETLAPYRDQLLVVSHLSNDLAADDGGGPHIRSSAAFLTGVNAKRTEGVGELQLGVSMDQVAANALAQDSPVRSLQLSIDSNDSFGTCELGYSCAYFNLSWSSPTTPLPMDINPRIVFERIFGDSGSTDPAVRAADARQKRSLLDFVTKEAAHLQTSLGPQDRAKLTEYLDAIRDTERRIQNVERQSAQLPTMVQPSGVPSHYGEHAKLLLDLVWLAYRGDITRIFTMMYGQETSDRVYTECGVNEPYHPITHHGGDADKIAKCVKVNRYHLEMTAHFLERLRSTPDGDGSLLDHTTLIHGCGMSDGSKHVQLDVPVAVIGGRASQIRGGRHLRFSPETPLANLHITLLHKLGVPIERLGNSTGELAGV